jgi:polyketide cyclase/dehydrase/lipid transport protein
MLKKIFIAVVLLIAGFAGVVALQPSEFHVERKATIAAPPAAVFAHVDDLHKWEAWSPWAKLDPNAKVGYESAPAGKGAAFTWVGNDKVGEGRMTLVESRPAEFVDIKVDFTRPFKGTNSSAFTFKPAGDGTGVTWTMSGHRNFGAKAMCLVLNGKKMIGDQLDNGLARVEGRGREAEDLRAGRGPAGQPRLA